MEKGGDGGKAGDHGVDAREGAEQDTLFYEKRRKAQEKGRDANARGGSFTPFRRPARAPRET